MTVRPLAPLLLAVGLVACVDDGTAPEGARLLLPDAVTVNWDEAFNGVDDGVGTMVPVDLMVYEGSTGEPLEQVDILFAALAPGAEILAAPDITVVSAACSSCVWDAGRDRYVSWRAGTSSARTDEDGLARVYVWVDAFPHADGTESADGRVEVAVALADLALGGGAFEIVAD
jgi:hypothetical protein